MADQSISEINPNVSEMHDVLLHTKSRTAGGVEITEKIDFPTTRWEAIIGAPKVLNPETIGGRYPAEWCIFTEGELAITDEEYNAIFGDMVTV